MINAHVYRVFDTEKQKYWTSPRNKVAWTSPAYAKNAWNANGRSWRKPPFNEQDRFVIHVCEMNVVEVIGRKAVGADDVSSRECSIERRLPKVRER